MKKYDCIIDKFSSRACEKGTKSCIVEHNDWPEKFYKPCTEAEFREMIKFDDDEIDINDVNVIPLHELGIYL